MGQFGVSLFLGVGPHPGFGEDGHWFVMRDKPTDAAPLRAIVSFPNGRATFDSPEDAMTYLEHPGDVKHAARHYLAAYQIEVAA